MGLVVHFVHLCEGAKVGEVDDVGSTHFSRFGRSVRMLDVYYFQHRTVPEEVGGSVNAARQVPVIAFVESESKVREVGGVKAKSVDGPRDAQ